MTFDSYAGLVRNHIVPVIGRVKLNNLSPAHVQGLYRSKLDGGLSPRTVPYLHSVLHRALKQALRWGLVPHNVAEAVDPPRVRKEEMRPLSSAQTRAYCSKRHTPTASKPYTYSQSIAACGRADCWASNGRTLT